MGKKAIYILLIVLAAIIVMVVVSDFSGKRPDKRAPNPFDYDMSDLKNVSPGQILYRETRNLNMKMERLRGISFFENQLFIIGDKLLQVLETNGKLFLEIHLPEEPVSLAVNNNWIFIGVKNSILVLNRSGNIVDEWKEFSDKSILTSIACYNDKVFIADAGLRVVYRFNTDGKKEIVLDGKADDDALHGFIVPSGYFDLAVNEYGDFWVANPGKHTLENYTFDGVMRGYWSATSSDIKGFTGCCNPSHFAFLPDGNFITSEKGILRIKEYKPSGEFVGVVVPPSKFVDEGNVSDVATDNHGRVYVCDPDKKSIRVFEKI